MPSFSFFSFFPFYIVLTYLYSSTATTGSTTTVAIHPNDDVKVRGLRRHGVRISNLGMFFILFYFSYFSLLTFGYLRYRLDR